MGSANVGDRTRPADATRWARCRNGQAGRAPSGRVPMITDTRSRNCLERAGTGGWDGPPVPKGGALSLEEIDLIDGRNFVAGVPYEWFAELRREAPLLAPRSGRPPGRLLGRHRLRRLRQVNRDWEHFSSARRGSLFPDMDDDQLAQQQLMMVNMDPTMHTRYRRLVNKGFTPKMVRDLEQQIVGYADGIIDAVCERGTADFVEEISAELPLLVIAELLGVPQEDRRMVFDWSNRMIGSEDPEYQVEGADPGEAAMQVYAYAEELAAARRLQPEAGPGLGPPQRRGGGREAERARARPLLPAPHRGRQRDHPEPDVGRHDRLLRPPRPVGAPAPGPLAAARRRRGDAALRHPGHALPPHGHGRHGAARPADQGGRQGRLLAHLGQPRRERRSRTPTPSTSPARPTTTSPSAAAGRTSASGPTWPAWRSW